MCVFALARFVAAMTTHDLKWRCAFVEISQVSACPNTIARDMLSWLSSGLRRTIALAAAAALLISSCTPLKDRGEESLEPDSTSNDTTLDRTDSSVNSPVDSSHDSMGERFDELAGDVPPRDHTEALDESARSREPLDEGRDDQDVEADRPIFDANVVFWTSSMFTLPELAAKGSMRDAGGSSAENVLAGADAACAEAALAPGSLAPSGTYVAWMSSDEDTALNRLKRAYGGQTPRGWVRVDGRPFLDQLSEKALYPNALDERGRASFLTGFSGTNNDGTAAQPNCADWSDYSSATYGVVSNANWSNALVAPCDRSYSVLCMQANYSITIVTPLAAPQAKGAFVAYGFDTSTGLEGADAKCQSDATANGLRGTFRALLAPTGASAASRFHPGGTLGYVRVDGVVVSEKDMDLLSASPLMLAPIAVSAAGDYFLGDTLPAYPFTGADHPQALGDSNCNGWTVASVDQATIGYLRSVGLPFFSAGLMAECTSMATIYCLED